MNHLKNFEDFFTLPYFCAKIVGIDLTKGRESFHFKLSVLAAVAGIVNYLYLMLFEFVFFHRHIGEFSGVVEITKISTYIAYGFNTNTKGLSILFGFRKIKHIVQTIQTIFPKTIKEKIDYQVNENFWPGYVYVVVGACFAAGWIIYGLPGIKSVFDFVNYGGNYSFETPFLIEHPFNFQTKYGYALAYLSEFVGGHLSVCTNLGVDLMLCCLARQMSMHFKYIGRAIEEYIPMGDPEDKIFIANLIERHQLVFKLCHEMNEIFGITLVFTFLTSSGIICFSVFQFTVADTKIEYTKFLLLFVSALGQLFIVSHFGDELIVSSRNVSESVYNHAWYTGNISYKKQLIILILRSQKPATLRAKGFTIVSLGTFEQVTSISYKAFTLLNTMYSGN